MIYAQLDVRIIDHPRLLEAGAVARDLWIWSLLYAQKHMTDGGIPMIAVITSTWGSGLKSNVKTAQKLIDVGLWGRTDEGYRILRYAEKNQTRETIEKNRQAARDRMERVRANKQRTASERSPEQTPNVQRTERERSFCPQGERSNVLICSDLDLSGSGGGTGEGPAPDDPAVKPSTSRYREAYCAGISEAKGSPYAWPPGPQSKFADEDLGLAIATFGKAKSGTAHRGDKLTAWIHAAAHDFAAHVIAGGDDPKFWSNFAPKGLVKFLNGEVRDEEARRVG